MSSGHQEEAILVVDDEKASTDLLRITLGADYPVLTANDGFEALSVLSGHPEIALAIIDHRMPGMTGVELIQQTVEPYPDLIRTILTGYADIESVIEAINAGSVYRYLTKPWHRDELLAVVKQGLEVHRLSRAQAVLHKVVSQEIAEEILRSGVQLGGEERMVSVLFGDIRDFTQFTEDMKPRATIELLNSCMSTVSEVIEDHGGVIDKYIGDSVMALFGAPVARDDAALSSVRCAMGILASVESWNEERRQSGLASLELGIGVGTGIVVAGNMGGQNRLNYTVVGKHVNLASRLCRNARGGEILISEDTLRSPGVAEAVHARPLGALALKGFSDPVPHYAVVGLR